MGFKDITTARLRFRPFSREDLDDLHQLWSDPSVRKYLWDDEVISRQRVESIIENNVRLFTDHRFGLWAISSCERDELIGFAGFWHFHEPPSLELVFGLGPMYWKQGFATEAVGAMLQYGFEELSFSQIVGSTDAANESSARVMERVGMTFLKRETTNGLDTLYYAISREDFNRTQLSTT
jgi:ribosomal-protein-alanine N-acetyltransferase